MNKNTEKSQVALVPCADYDEDRVYLALKTGLALLGGVEQFVRPEEKILLKPNLLRSASPERAVTTHPAVFSAVARILREAGCRDLRWGDSPGIGDPEKTASACGIAAAASRHQIPAADFRTSVPTSFPQGRQLKLFELCRGALEADAIISLSKMKTHQLTIITGAMKNSFGCIEGLHKGVQHTQFPDIREFSEMLADLNLFLGPRLHIMDGIVAMEGNGPASGTPVHMGVLLLSSDPVALDAVFCRLVDLSPEQVLPIVVGEERGLGRRCEEDVQVLLPDGGSWERFRNPEFDVERKKTILRGGGKWEALALLKNLAVKRPHITQEKCVRCGVCVNACPLEPKALTFPDQAHKKAPVYDHRRCIRCFCCQEMCPARAIDARMSLPLRLLVR
ncbi:MAG: DUF362 domain-containing protein [Bacillota bacterium]|nr:DUF362 domain-containing protein [Bacillota bacterium]